MRKAQQKLLDILWLLFQLYVMETCFRVLEKRDLQVSDVQPGVVELFDYYRYREYFLSLVSILIEQIDVQLSSRLGVLLQMLLSVFIRVLRRAFTPLMGVLKDT